MADDQQESGKSSRRVDVFLQRVPPTGAERNPETILHVFSGIAALLKAVALAALVVLLWVKWPYVATWLDAVSHFELPGGVKVDRSAASEKIHEISRTKEFDVSFAEAALARAELVLPALLGARVLWVDGMPSNNRLEEGVLQDMGMEVRRALSTPEALYLAERFDFDLVISNMSRPGNTSTSLKRCGAAYFELPDDDKLLKEYGDDLNRFNANIRTNPPAEFAMAEEFAQKFPDRFGDTQVPRIIFYTLASGGISASACGRIVTNRPDVLLQSVVSALEELRWKKLVPSKTQNKADARSRLTPLPTPPPLR